MGLRESGWNMYPREQAFSTGGGGGEVGESFGVVRRFCCWCAALRCHRFSVFTIFHLNGRLIELRGVLVGWKGWKADL